MFKSEDQMYGGPSAVVEKSHIMSACGDHCTAAYQLTLAEYT